MKTLSVGEIARRAGVSVRTLHYYEEIGLLTPARADSGHRRYGKASIERLQQIRSLQQLGFSLAQIDALVTRRLVEPERIVANQLASLQEQRKALARLEAQLANLLHHLQSSQNNDAEAIDVLLTTLEAMTMYEKHLTPEQLETVDTLHASAGDAATKWQLALDGLQAELDAGTAPDDPKVRVLAEAWHEAASAFMPADDEALHKTVMEILHNEPKARADHGLGDDLFAFLGRALAPDDHS